jgi:hypothetical protein
MHYLSLAEHDADICPTSNATTRELLLQTGQDILTGPQLVVQLS